MKTADQIIDEIPVGVHHPEFRKYLLAAMSEYKSLPVDLVDFAKWFNEKQWVGGKGDYLKGLFVKCDYENIVSEYLKSK